MFLAGHRNRVVRFNLAEALVRMAQTTDRLEELLSRSESITFSSATSDLEKGFAVLLLRVLLQHFSNFSIESLHRMTIVFLAVIRGENFESVSEKELFIQDVCCSALCQIFKLSQSLETDYYSSSNLIYSSLAEKISSLVISTLCREKRSLPTAGTSVFYLPL